MGLCFDRWHFIMQWYRFLFRQPATMFKGILNNDFHPISSLDVGANFTNKLQLSISCGDISISGIFFVLHKQINVSDAASQFKFHKSFQLLFVQQKLHLDMKTEEKRWKTRKTKLNSRDLYLIKMHGSSFSGFEICGKFFISRMHVAIATVNSLLLFLLSFYLID